MINRTLSVASAALIGSLAVTALSGDIAYAAESCRASPGTEAPPGGHWRYRLEKGTGNKCWYLAGVESGATVADEKPTADPKPAPAAPKQKSSELQPSVADARAELTTSESVQLNATVWPLLANANPSQNATAPTQKQNTVLAQRWPEPNSVRTSDDEFAEKMRVAANTSAQDATPVPSEPVAAQDAKDAKDAKDENTLSPIRILLVAVIGALALVAVLLRAILGYMSKRRKRKAPRRPIWDDLAIDAEQMPPYIPRSAPTQPAQYTGAQNPRYAYRDDEEAREEIEHLLRRAAQREQH